MQNVKPQLDVLGQQQKGAMDVVQQQQKGAQKLQTTQLEHDATQQSKQRAHEAKNPPPAPPPSIHINAPTKSMPAPNGRPSGTKRKKSTNKPRVLGSLDSDDQTLYSSSKLVEVIKSYDLLEKSVIVELKKKHNIDKLSDQQNEIASEISKVIARNTNYLEWNNNIEKYLNKPIDDNLDRISDIEDVAASMGLDPHLACLLFNSRKEDIKPEDSADSEVIATDSDVSE